MAWAPSRATITSKPKPLEQELGGTSASFFSSSTSKTTTPLLRALRAAGLATACAPDRLLGADRKEDADPGSVARAALDVDGSLRDRGRCRERRRHPEPAADELRREERVEHVRHGRSVHADAVVLHLEPDVGSEG